MILGGALLLDRVANIHLNPEIVFAGHGCFLLNAVYVLKKLCTVVLPFSVRGRAILGSLQSPLFEQVRKIGRRPVL
jgi:hypothetical protein